MIRKESVTLDQIKDDHSNASLTDLRILSVCVVGFAAFLRFDEIVSIKREDTGILFLLMGP